MAFLVLRTSVLRVVGALHIAVAVVACLPGADVVEVVDLRTSGPFDWTTGRGDRWSEVIMIYLDSDLLRCLVLVGVVPCLHCTYWGVHHLAASPAGGADRASSVRDALRGRGLKNGHCKKEVNLMLMEF